MFSKKNKYEETKNTINRLKIPSWVKVPSFNAKIILIKPNAPKTEAKIIFTPTE